MVYLGPIFVVIVAVVVLYELTSRGCRGWSDRFNLPPLAQ